MSDSRKPFRQFIIFTFSLIIFGCKVTSCCKGTTLLFHLIGRNRMKQTKQQLKQIKGVSRQMVLSFILYSMLA